MEFRDYFKNIFKKQDKSSSGGFTAVRMLNSYTPYVMSDNNNIYDNMLMRSCIDAIARNVAKLTPKVKGFKNRYAQRVEYLLKNSPNPVDSHYDFFYKITSQLLSNNNAFVFINYNDENLIEGFYPIPYNQMEFLEKDGELYCKFYFKNGVFKVILPYSEIIHLRRHYNENDLFGSDQTKVLNPIMTLLGSFVEGFVNAVRATSILRGCLKYGGNIKDEDLQRYKKQFVSSYMDMENGDGIGALDSKCDFVPIKIEPYAVDSRNQVIANKSIYAYYGVSESILTGDFNEDKFNAFYSQTIEPIGIQISEEFTKKVFTEKEITRGLAIVMSASRLTFANNSTKMNICKEGLGLGLFTANECREIFDFEPVEGGDKRIVSLNYVDADKQNEYQGVDKDKDEKKDNKGESKVRNKDFKDLFRHCRSLQPDEKFKTGEKDEDMTITGYAAVFDRSTVLWECDGVEYKEVISRGAFDGADFKNCCLKYNHVGGAYARTRGGSLSLETDDYGLKFTAKLLDTTDSVDLYKKIRGGLIDKCSFAFTVDEEEYDRTTHTRTIKKIGKLLDVSVVDIPAYEDTDVSARDYFKSEDEKYKALERETQRKRAILRLKLSV